jgi:hypothetical protein
VLLPQAEPPQDALCGTQMHSNLAVTTAGLSLGLAAMTFWARSQFKGCNAHKKKINPTRASIEKKKSIRWLENLKQSTTLLIAPKRCAHVGDLSDTYERFCTPDSLGRGYLVCTWVDPLAGDGKQTIDAEMQEGHIKGLHCIQVRDKNNNRSEAILKIKYRRI